MNEVKLYAKRVQAQVEYIDELKVRWLKGEIDVDRFTELLDSARSVLDRMLKEASDESRPD